MTTLTVEMVGEAFREVLGWDYNRETKATVIDRLHDILPVMVEEVTPFGMRAALRRISLPVPDTAAECVARYIVNTYGKGETEAAQVGEDDSLMNPRNQTRLTVEMVRSACREVLDWDYDHKSVEGAIVRLYDNLPEMVEEVTPHEMHAALRLSGIQVSDTTAEQAARYLVNTYGKGESEDDQVGTAGALMNLMNPPIPMTPLTVGMVRDALQVVLNWDIADTSLHGAITRIYESLPATVENVSPYSVILAFSRANRTLTDTAAELIFYHIVNTYGRKKSSGEEATSSTATDGPPTDWFTYERADTGSVEMTLRLSAYAASPEIAMEVADAVRAEFVRLVGTANITGEEV